VTIVYSTNMMHVITENNKSWGDRNQLYSIYKTKINKSSTRL